jgi:hypothetical protein
LNARQILHAVLSELLRHRVETQTFLSVGSNFINELRKRTPLESLTSTGNGISRSPARSRHMSKADMCPGSGHSDDCKLVRVARAFGGVWFQTPLTPVSSAGSRAPGIGVHERKCEC